MTIRHQQTDVHESITKQDRNNINDPHIFFSIYFLLFLKKENKFFFFFFFLFFFFGGGGGGGGGSLCYKIVYALYSRINIFEIRSFILLSLNPIQTLLCIHCAVGVVFHFII